MFQAKIYIMIGCRLCQSRRKRFITGESNFNLVKCQNCGLIYLDQDFSASQLLDYYQKYFDKNQTGHDIFDSFAFRHQIFQQIIKKIDSLVSPPGNLLDVGAAFGNFCLIAKNDGWQTVSLEINQPAVNYIKQNLKLEAYQSDIINYQTQKKFKVITFIDTLEHLREPLGSLKKAYQLLNKNGLIYIRVPNINFHLFKTKVIRIFKKDYQGLELPSHLTHFSPKTLKLILASSGFTKIKITPSPQEYLRKNLLKRLFQPFNYIIYSIFKVNIGNLIEATAFKSK